MSANETVVELPPAAQCEQTLIDCPHDGHIKIVVSEQNNVIGQVLDCPAFTTFLKAKRSNPDNRPKADCVKLDSSFRKYGCPYHQDGRLSPS